MPEVSAFIPFPFPFRMLSYPGIDRVTISLIRSEKETACLKPAHGDYARKRKLGWSI